MARLAARSSTISLSHGKLLKRLSFFRIGLKKMTTNSERSWCLLFTQRICRDMSATYKLIEPLRVTASRVSQSCLSHLRCKKRSKLIWCSWRCTAVMSRFCAGTSRWVRNGSSCYSMNFSIREISKRTRDSRLACSVTGIPLSLSYPNARTSL